MEMSDTEAIRSIVRNRVRYLFTAAPDETDSLPIVTTNPSEGVAVAAPKASSTLLKLPVLVRKREGRWFVLCPAGNGESYSSWPVAMFVARECHRMHGVMVDTAFFDNEEEEMAELGIKRPARNGAYVTTIIAQHVLWHLGDIWGPTRDGGHFVEALLQVFALADDENLEKLRENFPAYVQAWEAAQRTTWGLEWLRKVARGAEA
jgi:hypothetical protein